MDDLKTLMKKYLGFKPTFKLTKTPAKPKIEPVQNDDGPYIGEEAFVVGLGEQDDYQQ